MKKIISIITNIVIILIILLAIFIKAYDYKIFVVKTGSMKNEININDIIVVKKIQDIRINDIIAFEDDGYFIVHRVIDKNEKEIITKGDANNYPDEPIEANQIIGKVVFKISREILVIVIFTIIILNILSWILEITRKVK